MKKGIGKVLPGPCTLAEEAAAAIENIERQFPAEAGLIERMRDRLAVLQKAVDEMDSQGDWFASELRSIIHQAKEPRD